jgi:hypothetical protein
VPVTAPIKPVPVEDCLVTGKGVRLIGCFSHTACFIVGQGSYFVLHNDTLGLNGDIRCF